MADHFDADALARVRELLHQWDLEVDALSASAPQMIDRARAVQTNLMAEELHRRAAELRKALEGTE